MHCRARTFFVHVSDSLDYELCKKLVVADSVEPIFLQSTADAGRVSQFYFTRLTFRPAHTHKQQLPRSFWFSLLGVTSPSGIPTPLLVWRPFLVVWWASLFLLWPQRQDRVSCTTACTTETAMARAAGDLMLSMVVLVLWSRPNHRGGNRQYLLMTVVLVSWIRPNHHGGNRRSLLVVVVLVS